MDLKLLVCQYWKEKKYFYTKYLWNVLDFGAIYSFLGSIFLGLINHVKILIYWAQWQRNESITKINQNILEAVVHRVLFLKNF